MDWDKIQNYFQTPRLGSKQPSTSTAKRNCFGKKIMPGKDVSVYLELNKLDESGESYRDCKAFITCFHWYLTLPQFRLSGSHRNLYCNKSASTSRTADLYSTITKFPFTCRLTSYPTFYMASLLVAHIVSSRKEWTCLLLLAHLQRIENRRFNELHIKLFF